MSRFLSLTAFKRRRNKDRIRKTRTNMLFQWIVKRYSDIWFACRICIIRFSYCVLKVEKVFEQDVVEKQVRLNNVRYKTQNENCSDSDVIAFSVSCKHTCMICAHTKCLFNFWKFSEVRERRNLYFLWSIFSNFRALSFRRSNVIKYIRLIVNKRLYKCRRTGFG